MLNIMFQNNSEQCFLNSSYVVTSSVTYVDPSQLGLFVCSFTGNFLFGLVLLTSQSLFNKFKENMTERKNCDEKEAPKNSLEAAKNINALPKRSSSCPTLNRGFRPPENPKTLDFKQLQKITENDQIHHTENAMDYGFGGYMPVTLGNTVGPNLNYKIIRKLGWGHFSTVWLCKNLQQDDTYSALKISKAASTYKAVALDEINILKHVLSSEPSNPGFEKIVRLQDYFIENSVNGQHVCMSFEIMGPSLLDLIILSNYQGIEQPAAKNITKQVLIGLTYLHNICRIIHTDIKPENILIKVTDLYVRNMIDYVNRFYELGVQLPKSYVSTTNWADNVNLYEEGATGGSVSSSPSFQNSIKPRYPREKSYCEAKSKNKTHLNLNEEYSRDASPGKPLFVDPNIQIKIADLGNACWENRHFTSVIQTVQYRALEVILGGNYSFPADMWSVACVAFELCTGEYLFNPRGTQNLSMADDHLGLIWEVLDGIPQYVALSGERSRIHFNTDGSLRYISPDSLKIWKVEDVLVDKYGWKRVDAIIFADFIQSLIEPDQDLRASTEIALAKDWLRETNDQ